MSFRMGDTLVFEGDEFDRFPHVKERITNLWGSEECREYLNSITIEKERVVREGFPEKTFWVLTRLISYHDYLFPELVPPPQPWDHS